jgi:WD40 repeat protein
LSSPSRANRCAAKKAGKKPAGKKPADGLPEAPRIKSRIPLPTRNDDLDAQREDDVRNRIALNSNTAPSVCFYTFTNTHAALNCTTITSDGSSIAAGGSDSIVRLWDLKKRAQTQSLMSQQQNVANNTVQCVSCWPDGKPLTFLQLG